MFVKYYAVKTNEENKIFSSWDECKEFIKGKKGVAHKSFSSLEDANAFLNGEEIVPNYDLPTAYIDGSYHLKTEEYSFGAVLIIDQKLYQFKKKYDKDEFSTYRNVAGEIKGAGFIIKYAINHHIKEMNLYYDYEGIEKWYTGSWKANSMIALKYVEFKEQVKNDIIIHFYKVKSHTNNKYNDMVDHLAKEALGIE